MEVFLTGIRKNVRGTFIFLSDVPMRLAAHTPSAPSSHLHISCSPAVPLTTISRTMDPTRNPIAQVNVEMHDVSKAEPNRHPKPRGAKVDAIDASTKKRILMAGGICCGCVLLCVCAFLILFAVAAIEGASCENGPLASTNTSSTNSTNSNGGNTNTNMNNNGGICLCNVTQNVTAGTGGTASNATNTTSGGSHVARIDYLELARKYIGLSCNAFTGKGCAPQMFPGAEQVRGWNATNILDLPSNARLDMSAPVFPGPSLHHHGGFWMDLQDFSQSMCESFQIPLDSSIYSSIAFSAWKGAYAIWENLEGAGDPKVQAMSTALFPIATVQLPVGAFLPSAELLHDMNNVAKSVDREAWDAFVDKHGTHFVSSVTFGGSVQANFHATLNASWTDAQRSVWWQERSTKASDSFQYYARLNVSKPTNYYDIMDRVDIVVQGGAEDTWGGLRYDGFRHQPLYEPDFAPWENSLATHPEVIQVVLTPIATLFPGGDAKRIESTIANTGKRCPGASLETQEWEQCGGIGWCEWETGVCNCPSLLIGGPACNETLTVCGGEMGWCHPHGVCDMRTGTCQCDSFFMGERCDQVCGTQVFTTNLVSKTDSPNTYFMQGNWYDSIGNRLAASQLACQRLLPKLNSTGPIWSTRNTFVQPGNGHIQRLLYPGTGEPCDRYTCNYFKTLECALNTSQIECPNV